VEENNIISLLRPPFLFISKRKNRRLPIQPILPILQLPPSIQKEKETFVLLKEIWNYKRLIREIMLLKIRVFRDTFSTF